MLQGSINIWVGFNDIGIYLNKLTAKSERLKQFQRDVMEFLPKLACNQTHLTIVELLRPRVQLGVITVSVTSVL